MAAAAMTATTEAVHVTATMENGALHVKALSLGDNGALFAGTFSRGYHLDVLEREIAAGRYSARKTGSGVELSVGSAMLELEPFNADAAEKLRIEVNARMPLCGRTSPDAWTKYSNGLMVTVDISHHHLSRTPIIVTSLHGNSSHWTTTGGCCVYNATATSFLVYLHKEGTDLTPAFAKDNNWHIEYILMPAL